MPFSGASLLQGVAVAVVADVVLYWALNLVLAWHTRSLAWLLDLASVPWEPGGQISVLLSIRGSLVRTSYLDYQLHPWYPATFLVGAVLAYAIAHKFGSPPVRLLVALIPVGLGATLLYFHFVSPSLPYSAEDFAASWYRGEVYLWLLLPWIFGIGLFTLNVPLTLKLPYLVGVFLYAVVWSVVRLATALATFHYFGAIWMPLFYFLFGFLADFLYIVASYSLAMDRAAAHLAQQKEVWQS
jgi:hypothetical protein